MKSSDFDALNMDNQSQFKSIGVRSKKSDMSMTKEMIDQQLSPDNLNTLMKQGTHSVDPNKILIRENTRKLSGKGAVVQNKKGIKQSHSM